MEKLFVKLSSCVNPDRSVSDTNKKIKAILKEVNTLLEASNVCRKFIEENELGSGNWDGGEISDGEGKFIARVSYNGRVWKDKIYVPNGEEFDLSIYK